MVLYMVDLQTLDTVVRYIASVGFPIVCCFFMWKYINETMSKTNELLTKICDKLDMWKEGEE